MRTWALVLGGLALVAVLVALAPSPRRLAIAGSELPAMSTSQAPATFVVPAPKPRPTEIALVGVIAVVLVVAAMAPTSRRERARLARRQARHVSLRGPPPPSFAA